MTILVDIGATKEDTGVLAVREILFSVKELWTKVVVLLTSWSEVFLFGSHMRKSNWGMNAIVILTSFVKLPSYCSVLKICSSYLLLWQSKESWHQKRPLGLL